MLRPLGEQILITTPLVDTISSLAPPWLTPLLGTPLVEHGVVFNEGCVFETPRYNWGCHFWDFFGRASIEHLSFAINLFLVLLLGEIVKSFFVFWG